MQTSSSMQGALTQFSAF